MPYDTNNKIAEQIYTHCNYYRYRVCDKRSL